MSLSFVRSTRALHADRERPALIVLITAILLLLLWSVWFFWAPITQYEVGQLVGAARRGMLVADFPAKAFDRLQPGQLALLQAPVYPADDAGARREIRTIPAMVMVVSEQPRADQVQVELATLSDQGLDLAAAVESSAPITVVVEVAQLSPAQLVWRASGQWIDTPSVLLHPQAPSFQED